MGQCQGQMPAVHSLAAFSVLTLPMVHIQTYWTPDEILILRSVISFFYFFLNVLARAFIFFNLKQEKVSL